MSNKRKALPVGFFDDPLADAKARKINVDEEVKKVQEKEWAEFQSFVASVETTERDDDEAKIHEAVEEDGLEKLKQMEYLDRVRKALLKASKKEKGEDDEAKSEDNGEKVEDDDNDDGNVNQVLAKGYQARIKNKKVEEDDADDDLLNWRTRRH